MCKKKNDIIQLLSFNYFPILQQYFYCSVDYLYNFVAQRQKKKRKKKTERIEKK